MKHNNYLRLAVYTCLAILLGIIVGQAIYIKRVQPKIAMADMVIAAANSAPTNTGALICVTRQ